MNASLANGGKMKMLDIKSFIGMPKDLLFTNTSSTYF